MSFPDVDLNSKYRLREGRIYLNGVQALVRLPLMQHARDVAAGLNTAGFISGYRGSPLGTFDQQLWKARSLLQAHHIHFQPGLNEELAGTAVWGSQQTNLFPGAKYDGVFAMWYGKAPGVDRAGDAFRHGNAAGASRFGGVLVLLGDDHNCKSASLPSQSEYACVHSMMPVLHPAGLADLMDFGLLGWALSRFSGAWVGLKCLIDTMDMSASIEVDGERARAVLPPAFNLPAGGLNIRWPDPPLEQERRQFERIAAIHAFARANRLDYATVEPSGARRLAIVATGKAYQDVRQALHELGMTPPMARELGIGVYKVGMTWPLEPEAIGQFARGFETLLVVEEKRGLIEEQLAHCLFSLPDAVRPRLIGKKDEQGAPLLPATGEFSATQIALLLGRRISRWHPSDTLAARLATLERQASWTRHEILPKRLPYFCPGCPHNTSTVVPDGSRALAGIGCHYMAQWMDRETDTFTQMGGEGASWIGQAPFTSTPHVFANLGDGTFAHSGSLAIRAAVAARVNITYKLLYNDAVAMTGGQPVEARLNVPQIAAMLLAEGVTAIRVVADDPRRYARALPAGVALSGRETLEAVQRELRDTPGASVLIYDQTCAAELRRRRKRRVIADPLRRIFINERVCEGCGDCGVQSNCTAIVPLETDLGRKRQIDQSACNKDTSCLRGFCPSFVTVVGGRFASSSPRREPAAPSGIPLPRVPDLVEPCGMVIGGIGGTGVVTIGGLLGMAAHLEGKGVTVLDMVGLAQKGGQVLSQVWLAATPEQILATRIPAGRAMLLLGCDLVVAAHADTLALLDPDRARAAVNVHEAMLAEFTHQPDLRFPGEELRSAIVNRLDTARTDFIDASRLATQSLGDSVFANVLLLGYAWQKGWIALSFEALMGAIELNGSAIAENKAAFAEGRRIASEPKAEPLPRAAPDVRELIARRARSLIHYQDAAYARRYELLALEALATEEERIQGGHELAAAVAENLYKLMAYKDEYEVARLFAQTDFLAGIRRSYQGDIQFRFHLAPPLLSRRDPNTGHPAKWEFGPWMHIVFRALAKARRLRGTPFDPFGFTAERIMERKLIADYEVLIAELLNGLSRDNHALAVELAGLSNQIRGFGPVKEEARTRVKVQEAQLLATFRGAAASAASRSHGVAPCNS